MSNSDLDNLRASIDNLDTAMLFLLAERFRVTRKIGEYKQEHRLPATDEDRERLQFERIHGLALALNLNPEFAHRLFRLIVGEVVTNHKRLQEEGDT